MAEAVIGALRVTLGADSAAFEKSMNDLSDKLVSIGKKLRAVGAGLTAAITVPLIAFAKKSYDAFQQSDKAIKAVEAALKSTGNTVGFTSAKLQEMAAGLQKITTYDDDRILGEVTASLLRFGNLSGEVFKDAQVAVLDVATAMKTDLASAAVLVGKALNDPAKGLSALRRAGISFSAAQTKVIERLIETGQTARAQQAILEAFATAFGGQAEALTRTAEGKWAQAWNAIGDAMEKVGAVLAPLVIKVADAVKSMAEAFTALDPEVQKFVVYTLAAAAAIGPLLIGVGAVVAAIGAIGVPAIATGAAIAGLAAAIAMIGGVFDETSVKLALFGFSWESVKAKLAGLGEFFRTEYEDLQRVLIGLQIFGVEYDIFLLKLAGATEVFSLRMQQAWLGWQMIFGKVADYFAIAGLAIEAAVVRIAIVFVDIRLAVLRATQALVGLAITGITAVIDLYNGVKSWLQEKLTDAIDYVIQKIKDLKEAFKDLYESVVGKSYIPDMVDESIGHLKRMAVQLPRFADVAAAGMAAAFAGLSPVAMDLGAAPASRALQAEMAGPGVNSSGTAAAPTYISIPSLNINTPDYASFVEAKDQIAGDIADVVEAALRNRGR